ncbi:MAG TPA: hypothetical protein VMH87_19805 [Pseudomonadales bacterium]|nr:hypothetical protein [Pseudomonadales bacterium]
MALSAIAHAESAPVPTGPDTDAAHQKADMKNRIESLRKKMHGRNPGANVPAPGHAAPIVPEPNVAPSSHAAPGNTPGNNDPSNPYTSIAVRNVFGLNPPTPVTIVQPDTTPPPKITLTGITTIFGPAEALYKVAGVPQQGKPAKDQSYILREGEGQDDIIVQNIDVAKAIVTFNNHGQVQDIPLMVGVASGGSGGGGGGFQQPQSGAGGRPGYNNSLQNFRQRMEQQRTGNQTGYNPAGNNNGNPAGQSGYNGYGGSSYNNGNNANNSTPLLSADDEQALIAAQHAQLQSQGSPTASLFPPSKYDDQANQEAGVTTGSDPTGSSTPSTIAPVSRGANGLFRSPSSSMPSGPQ